jgi:hypothetical protein
MDRPHTSRLKSLATVVLGSFLFVLLVVVINVGVKTLCGTASPSP